MKKSGFTFRGASFYIPLNHNFFIFMSSDDGNSVLEIIKKYCTAALKTVLKGRIRPFEFGDVIRLIKSGGIINGRTGKFFTLF